jgi:heme exporter protein C
MYWRIEMSERSQSRLDAVLGMVLLLGMILALYMALIEAPRERTMGDLQRIFYFHVPAGITGITAFAVNFVASVMFIVRRNRWWDSLALSAAEIGVMFLAIVLITGPIWAKPAWLVWWTWSPRLTASLVLCLLYTAYLLIRNYIEDPERKAMVSAAFGVIAFLDVPIVWFSIRWAANSPRWRDIHPPAMLESGGLDPAMRPAFLICLAVFQVLMIYLLRRRFYIESLSCELERIEREAGAR